MSNLKRVGIDFHELIEVPSEIALPKLLSENKTYDFAFIDGWHTFDHTLIDFFYLNRMLKIGGIIVIDDVSYPSVSKLMRYLMRYPGYKMVGNIQIETSTKKKLFELVIRKPFSLFSKLFPKRIQQELFSGKVIASDSTLGLNASMIAFKKIKEDERPWYWFEDF